MKKRLAQLLVCAVLLFLPFFALHNAAIPVPSAGTVMDGYFFDTLERRISDAFPFRDALRRAALRIALAGGQTEQNNIFISDEGLIKNVAEPNEQYLRRNTDAVLRFSKQVQVPTYLMLIPTASAVLQQRLPPYAEIYNQKQLIEDVYRQMINKVMTVDVYSTLYSRRSEYIYYRTENNLTALGGYYVYSALGSRLVDRAGVQDFSRFNIEYGGRFYGDLYRQTGYSGVRADILSMYRHATFSREYTVTHTGPNDNRVYHTLYPRHFIALGRPLDVYFGGVSAVTDIRTSTPYARSLLVFGDRTALAWLPFLTHHYERVTLVDLFQLTDIQAGELNLGLYDQILFAYSTETFDTDIPQRALALAEQ